MASIVPVNATTYQLQLGSYGLVTIGGGPQFMPGTSLSKWGEVSLSHQIVSPTAVPPILQSGKQLSWQNNALGMTVLWDVLDPTDQFEDGGIDISIITTKAALQAGISFPMNMTNLIAEYQPALTADSIAHGSSRPVNVVGSYAFYHATRGMIHEASVADIYKTSKAFHLFAPKFTEQLGKTIYGTWNLAGSVLSAVVDPTWLAAATDPITLDPTYGYSSVGASQTTCYVNTTTYLQIFGTSPAGTNTLTNLSINGNCFGDGNATVRVGWYTEKAGPAPNARQTGAYDTADWTWTDSAVWHTNPVAWSYALTAATQYWGAVSSTVSYPGPMFDTGTNSRYYNDTVGLPASAAGSSDDTTDKFSMYATYTAAGGAVLDEDGLTHQFVTRW